MKLEICCVFPVFAIYSPVFPEKEQFSWENQLFFLTFVLFYRFLKFVHHIFSKKSGE